MTNLKRPIVVLLCSLLVSLPRCRKPAAPNRRGQITAMIPRGHSEFQSGQSQRRFELE
jgi:hypothetical protein